ncbi:uncharacterized protein [Anabrus simplex]|uniref:uncharacterized protein n=1 Tax=Anabrus simplex TaxID=316456 RepID=UPI0035A29CF0
MASDHRMFAETEPLLGSRRHTSDVPAPRPLSLLFATLCIIDLFGVFPIITLPRTIINCGWLGIPLALLLFSIQIYTAVLLGRCWLIAEKLQPTIVTKTRYPYAALADLTFGKKIRRLVTILLDLTIFGAAVPNLLVASQNLQLVGLKMSHYEFNFSFCIWMVIIGVILSPIMWLGSPKDMNGLTAISVLIVLSVTLLTWICMMSDTTVLPPFELPRPSWKKTAVAYGVLAFQFDIHPMILTVQVDMKNKKKLGHAIAGGFLVTASLFIATTLFAIFRYGSAVTSNVLQGLPASTPLYINVLLVTLQICLSTVVGVSPLFQDLEDKLNISREANWRRCVLRTCLLLSAILLGEIVPRFDLLMELIGGTLTGPLMFILPPLLYFKLRSMNSEVNSCNFEALFPENEKETVLRYTEVLNPKEASAFREAIATHKLFSDTAYRRLEDDTTLSPPSPGCWRRLTEVIDNFLSLEGATTVGPMTRFELTVTIIIVTLGVIATLITTVFSLWDTIAYANFYPPCILK